MDANLLHVSYEGRSSKIRGRTAENMSIRARVRPRSRARAPHNIEIAFDKGEPVAIDGKHFHRRAARELNKIGREHGIGRVDLVENRFVGMKSRGVYETPGGTILHCGASRHRVDHT